MGGHGISSQFQLSTMINSAFSPLSKDPTEHRWESTVLEAAHLRVQELRNLEVEWPGSGGGSDVGHPGGCTVTVSSSLCGRRTSPSLHLASPLHLTGFHPHLTWKS